LIWLIRGTIYGKILEASGILLIPWHTRQTLNSGKECFMKPPHMIVKTKPFILNVTICNSENIYK
jgi:hypothetical protein